MSSAENGFAAFRGPIDRRVFEPGFEHCRPYCNPAAGLPNDGMLAEKYKCLGKLSQIQRCFYVSQRP